MVETVFISGKLDQDCVNVLRQNKRLHVVYKPDCNRQELIEGLQSASFLVTRSETSIDGELLAKAPELKFVGRAAVGTSNIDIKTATDRGILVFNTPGKNTNSAAELSFALLLSMLRHIPQAHHNIKSGGWDRHRYTGRELRHLSIGIVGLGNVGHRMAKFAHGFDMKVHAYDPYISQDKFERYRVRRHESLKELASNVDILSLHVPLNDETKEMVSAPIIEALPRGSFIINAARGGLASEVLLAQYLNNGHLAGVAIDTWETEPRPNQELYSHPKVVCSPHIGASTLEAQKLVGKSIVTQIQKVLDGTVVDFPVNLPNLEQDPSRDQKFYTLLAEKLGSFASQALDFNPKRVLISFYGELAQKDTTIISIGFMKGYAAKRREDYVSHVNAQRCFDELGLTLEENKNPDFDNIRSAIKVSLEGETDRELSISGLVFNEEHIRISSVNGFTFELEPKGMMLILENKDMPGVIGKVGTFLGKERINIDSFHLSRSKEGGKAMAIIKIDSRASTEQLESLQTIKDVMSARQIQL